MSPTQAAWTVIPAYVVAVDVWLIRHGHPTLSMLARQHPRLAVGGTLLLATHLARAWRFDPLHVAANHLRLRVTP